jgi:hypothetical protein
MMRRSRFVVLAALAAAVGLWAADVDPNRFLDDVKYLASPALKGRGTGTPGLEMAARFIEKQFKAAGLQPVDGQYFQPFPVTTNARLGHNHFEYTGNGHRKTLKLEQDFVPFNFSSSGKLEGPLVFAGYGITAPEYQYDDYAGLDAKGKIVVVMRDEPQENDEKSVFDGKLLTSHALNWSKAVNAKRHGAAGVLLVADRANHPGEPDGLEKFGRTAGPVEAGIPFLQVRASIAADWLAAAGQNLDRIEADIDKDLKPRSFALPESIRVSAAVAVKREVKTVRNVAGYLPGEMDEYVILGAHYDHLGLGEQYSMAPSQAGMVHPGADDNASGTAGVIELARWFGGQPKQKRGILFLAFAGEEMGLLGSRYWVDHPELPLAKAVAMINMDMIGRVRDHKVYIGGARSGTTLQALLAESLPKHRLVADYTGGGEAGSSDHASFESKQIPAVFFFSGLHSDYHKPSDTWDKIDAPDAAELLDEVADFATQLEQAPGRPEFVKVEPPKSALAARGGSGYGAWFGSVPDFGETPRGVKFADVTAGSPAAQGGLKGGDILIEFDGAPIQNIYDFTYALRGHKPGDTVVVKVLRGGETISAKVTLRQRPR